MKKKISVEDALIKGLEDARDFERGKKTLRTHTRELPPPAPHFSSRDVRRLRKDIFGVTQEEFAQILNVAVTTVRSWEQGARSPAEASNRLLQILEHLGPTFLKELKTA
jgi:DNA-binding transcriptional regulator YiaG